MNILIWFFASLIPLWILISTYLDVKLYKNKKTRKLIETKMYLKEDELFAEFFKINLMEALYFINGFFLAYLLIKVGLL